MWYYAIGSERLGPVDQTAIEELIRSGALNTQTLVWRDGMSQWIPLHASPLGAIPGAIPAPVPYVEGRTMSGGTGTVWPGPDMTCGVDGTDKMFRSFWIWLIPAVIGYGIVFAGIGTESILLMIVGLIITLTSAVFTLVYFCKFLYRCWMLVSDGKARTVPGNAVGFMFIPLFNIYWQFVAYWGLTLEMNRVIDEYKIPAPRPNPQLMLWYLILGVLGWIPAVGILATLASLVVGVMAFLQVKATARAMLEWNLAQQRSA